MSSLNVRQYPYIKHLTPKWQGHWMKVEEAESTINQIVRKYGRGHPKLFYATENLIDLITEPTFVAWQWEVFRQSQMTTESLPPPITLPRIGKLMRRLIARVEEMQSKYVIESPQYQMAYHAYIVAYKARIHIGEASAASIVAEIAENPVNP